MAENSNIALAEFVVEELVRHGIRYFVACSGNRSAPLLWVLSRRTDIRVLSHYDERSAAFCALGIGRAIGRAAAVVTTSGTAVANLLPAAVEAAYDNVPLLLLTADRPWELHYQGANQTIEQQKLLDSVLRWSATLPAVDATISSDAILHYLARAVMATQTPIPGPVQLNCQFREPLHPVQQAYSVIKTPAVQRWNQDSQPFEQAETVSVSSDVLNRQLERWMQKAQSPVVIVGALRPSEREALETLMKMITVPVITDITSGFRGKSCCPSLLPFFDLGLLHPTVWQWSVDRVLWIGGRMVSKRLVQWLAKQEAEILRLSSHPNEINPALQRVRYWQFPLERWSGWPKFPSISVPTAVGSVLNTIRARVQSVLRTEHVTEAVVLDRILRYLTATDQLFLGNSIVVRDADSFVYDLDHCPAIFANRGASGIDGLLSTAAGIAEATGRRTIVVLGDLSLLHDINGLHFVAQLSAPLVVVVVNNYQGGIFRRVVSPENAELPSLIVVPHSYSFESVAEMFNLDYQRLSDRQALEQQWKKLQSRDRPIIVEIPLERENSYRAYQRLVAQIQQMGNGGTDR